MKPKLLNQVTPSNAANDEVVVFDGDTGYKIKKSSISMTELQAVVANNTKTQNHISDDSIHLSSAEKSNVLNNIIILNNHINNTNDSALHVSKAEKDIWDNKETQAGAQAKAKAVQDNLDSHIGDESHLSNADREILNNVYKKSEVDNKISEVITSLEWKAAVST